MNNVKLFCFPFGGGSSTFYFNWEKYLNKNIVLRPVELKARGTRSAEPNYNSIDDAVDDVFNIIKKDLRKGPYAFFGHSLGGIIAFELAYKIKKESFPYPHHIFISGRGAPHRPWHEVDKFYLLPEKEFREKIATLGGIPEELYEVPELLDMVFTLLRGDCRVAETYSFVEKNAPLECGITIISAVNDEPTPDDIAAWEMHAGETCDFHSFEGGHFFLKNKTENVVNIINDKLGELFSHVPGSQWNGS